MNLLRQIPCLRVLHISLSHFLASTSRAKAKELAAGAGQASFRCHSKPDFSDLPSPFIDALVILGTSPVVEKTFPPAWANCFLVDTGFSSLIFLLLVLDPWIAAWLHSVHKVFGWAFIGARILQKISTWDRSTSRNGVAGPGNVL